MKTFPLKGRRAPSVHPAVMLDDSWSPGKAGIAPAIRRKAIPNGAQ
jgi:hypothetical protein